MDIYVLGTLKITVDILDLLINYLPIKGVIGLSNRKADKISGFQYLRPYCEGKGLDFIEVEDYSLRKEKDKDKIEQICIDVLLVFGWQRLIPNWLIRQCRIGAFGIHGSSRGINLGRGRSPQNWALILGHDKFYLSLFKITEGIDDGPIFATRHFDLSIFDDIKTSYYKVVLLSSEMIIELIRSIDRGDLKLYSQGQEAEYLPKREPLDGYIDWNVSSMEIYNFVRALTKPYPGALTILDNQIIRIWRVIPFNIDLSGHFIPGQIVKVFSDGEILVKTLDSYVLIMDYECQDKFLLVEGKKFESFSFKEQIKNIIKRHYDKYPNLKISRDLIKIVQ